MKTARTLSTTRLEAIRDRASDDVLRSRESVRQGFEAAASSVHRVVADAKQSSKALFLEVAGQGPEKTLSRGLAIVRDEQGKPIQGFHQAFSNLAHIVTNKPCPFCSLLHEHVIGENEHAAGC